MGVSGSIFQNSGLPGPSGMGVEPQVWGIVQKAQLLLHPTQDGPLLQRPSPPAAPGAPGSTGASRAIPWLPSASAALHCGGDGPVGWSPWLEVPTTGEMASVHFPVLGRSSSGSGVAPRGPPGAERKGRGDGLAYVLRSLPPPLWPPGSAGLILQTGLPFAGQQRPEASRIMGLSWHRGQVCGAQAGRQVVRSEVGTCQAWAAATTASGKSGGAWSAAGQDQGHVQASSDLLPQELQGRWTWWDEVSAQQAAQGGELQDMAHGLELGLSGKG